MSMQKLTTVCYHMHQSKYSARINSDIPLVVYPQVVIIGITVVTRYWYYRALGYHRIKKNSVTEKKTRYT